MLSQLQHGKKVFRQKELEENRPEQRRPVSKDKKGD
jgi:hypothetical protein